MYGMKCDCYVLRQEERLRHAFERLDADESGFITVANLRELVGPCCDDEALQKTIEVRGRLASPLQALSSFLFC